MALHKSVHREIEMKKIAIWRHIPSISRQIDIRMEEILPDSIKPIPFRSESKTKSCLRAFPSFPKLMDKIS